MTTTTTRRAALLAAALAGALALGGCYIDADGDGIDDNTGKPIPSHVGASGDCAGWGPLSSCDREDPRGLFEPSRLVPDEGVPLQRIALAARHEAGHKAVADEYGWTVVSVVVRADGSGESKVRGLRGKPPEQVAAFLVAGVVAAGTDEGADDDLNKLDDLLLSLPDAEAERVEAVGYAEAERIVRERAELVARDTEVLCARGRL